MRERIEITRFWIAADGIPHQEVAQLLRVPQSNPRGHRFDMDTIEGVASSPMPNAPMRIVVVSDPAVDPGVLGADMNTLYELPLIAGARLVTGTEWAQTSATRADADAQMDSEIEAMLAAQRAAEREQDRQDLTLTPAQIASAVAAYMAVNPPAGPSTQQIASAVAAHLEAHPAPVGRPPTQEELLASVSLYVAAHADQLRGPQGVAGAAGATGATGAAGATGATGAQGAAGTPADPTAVANLQSQVTLLLASYNAGMEVRIEQVPIPLLALGATATRIVTWTPAFTTGRTVVVDVFADALIGKATLEIIGTPSVTSVEVKITAALAITATTGIVVGISRKAAI